MMKSIPAILLLLASNWAWAQWNQSSFVPLAGLYEVDFPDESAAYIVGDLGSVYKSTDEGITWSPVYSFGPFTSPRDLKFINADTGFVNIYGDQYRTVDGGISWTQFGTFPRLKFHDGDLFTSHTSNDTTYISMSADLGDTWTTLFQHYQIGSQPFILSVVDHSNLYFIAPSDLDRVYKTTDGFLSVDTLFITTGDLVLQEQFDYKDLQHGYHYGSWGSQSHPTRTWNTGTFYFPIDLDGFGVLPVLDLDFNTTRLYAGSLYGKIFHSMDHGQTWTEEPTPISDPIHSISFVNNDKGIAVSANKVLYTSTGGSVAIGDVQPAASVVQVHPNPTDGVVSIQNSSRGTMHFVLYNTLGEKILEKTLPIGTSTMDLSSYSKQAYLYIVTTQAAGIVAIGKLIKE